jgi:hypothetical protein
VAKKSAKKTTSKTPTAKGKRTATTQSTKGTPPVKRSDLPRREAADRGAPIEHYHGEPNRGKKTGDPGSLEEETLDRDAPYNKTYGLTREERTAE